MTIFELREYRNTEEGNTIFEDVVETLYADESAINYLKTPEHEYDHCWYEWVCIGGRAEQINRILNS